MTTPYFKPESLQSVLNVFKSTGKSVRHILNQGKKSFFFFFCKRLARWTGLQLFSEDRGHRGCSDLPHRLETRPVAQRASGSLAPFSFNVSFGGAGAFPACEAARRTAARPPVLRFDYRESCFRRLSSGWLWIF